MPLTARVTRDGVLTIEIGVNTLARSTLCAPFAWEMLGEDQERTKQPDERFSISSPRGFAVDVKRALLDEREDGSSLLTDMLDAAEQRAIEDGSEFFVDDKDKP